MDAFTNEACLAGQLLNRRIIIQHVLRLYGTICRSPGGVRWVILFQANLLPVWAASFGAVSRDSNTLIFSANKTYKSPPVAFGITIALLC